MPKNLEMEKAYVNRQLRLPGLHSENLGLDIIQNKASRFGFEDYLSNTSIVDSETSANMHQEMEKQLKLKVKL